MRIAIDVGFRRSRESGNPVSSPFNGSTTLDPRVRGDDGAAFVIRFKGDTT
ncbi:MAG: hypothetical protein U1F48_17685 [Burkholderiales bacterium]